MSEWDNLKTYEDWKNKLAELMDEARRASQANDDAALISIAPRLRTFVQKSRPNTPEVLALDRIAADAQRALTLQLASDAIARIEARTSALLVLGKTLQQIGARAEADASVLRLDRSYGAVDAIIGAHRAISD